jgi:hypothetical protein
MIWSPPSRSAAASPDELAAAMRHGVEARRFFRPPQAPLPPRLPAPPAADLFPQIYHYGCVLGHPTPATGGPVGRLLRLARKVAKTLLNPWLDKQTHFNHTTYEYLRQMHDYLADVADRVDQLNRHVVLDVTPQYKVTNARLNEALYDLYQLRRQLAGDGELPADDSIDARPPVPADPVHVIEGLYLHTRLAPPPGRVLVLAPLGLHALDLASLGYQVVLAGATHDPLAHPNLRVGPDGAALPEDTFDCAVTLCGEGEHTHGAGIAGPAGARLREAVARALTGGGKVIGSWPVEDEVPTAAELAELVKPLRVVESAYAVRAGHGWRLSPAPTPDAELVLWVAGTGGC